MSTYTIWSIIRSYLPEKSHEVINGNIHSFSRLLGQKHGIYLVYCSDENTISTIGWYSYNNMKGLVRNYWRNTFLFCRYWEIVNDVQQGIFMSFQPNNTVSGIDFFHKDRLVGYSWYNLGTHPQCFDHQRNREVPME